MPSYRDTDGELYTRAEFVAEYGGTGAWDAAKRPRNYDEQQPAAVGRRYDAAADAAAEAAAEAAAAAAAEAAAEAAYAAAAEAARRRRAAAERQYEADTADGGLYIGLSPKPNPNSHPNPIPDPHPNPHPHPNPNPNPDSNPHQVGSTLARLHEIRPRGSRRWTGRHGA